VDNETRSSEVQPEHSGTPPCCSAVRLFRRPAALLAVVLVAATIAYWAWGNGAPRGGGDVSPSPNLTEAEIAERIDLANPINLQRMLEAHSNGQYEHPLDPVLAFAYFGLHQFKENVEDYTARLIKQERVGDRLQDEQELFVKIRSERRHEDDVVVPLSVYLRFDAPRSVRGREVIWVDGRNDGKLIAHQGGLINLIRVRLDPDGILAMMGNRYPVYKIGIRNLIEELIVKGHRTRQYEDVEVEIVPDQEVEGRPATLVRVTHLTNHPEADFYIAEIHIDQEHELPIQYAAYDWPNQSDTGPVLLERYTYADLQLNVNLSDSDFDPDNPEYNYP
jgi:hypothetical protein